MSQAEEDLINPVSETYVGQSSYPSSRSHDSPALNPSYPSSSRDVTPELEVTSVHEDASPSTSYCASTASQPAVLDQEHPPTKGEVKAIANTTGMARSQDGMDGDSDCADEHEGGVSLVEQQDDLVINQEIDPLIEVAETPQQSPSGLDHLQQHSLPSLPVELFMNGYIPPEDTPTSISLASVTHNLMDGFPEWHFPPVENGTDMDASVTNIHGQITPPNMISDAEEEHIGALNWQLDLAPTSSEHSTDNNAFWDSYSMVMPGESAGVDPFSISFPAESAVDDPYPQLLPWYANSAYQDYQYEIGFFGPQDERKNMSFLECLRFWRDGYSIQQKDPNHSLRDRNHFVRLTDHDINRGITGRKRHAVDASDLKSERCDFQGIDWTLMGVERRQARIVRRNTYFNHANLLTSYPQAQIFNLWPMFSSSSFLNHKARSRADYIRSREEFFCFSQLMRHHISIPHFQLRHIVAASSKNAVFFPTVVRDEDGMQTTASQISCVNPEVEFDDLTIDSARSDVDSDAPSMQKIYTLSASHGILAAGGLGGEYAFRSLSSPPTETFTSGLITLSPLSSTNHVHTYYDRRSGLPRAVFSSNDNNIHTLDCTTNKFISHHDHIKPVNCAATSPDTRLRVLVRDAEHSLLVEADTGKRIGKLSGHSDFGFACDWADDGVHVATGAQDGLVQIYDMRNWRSPLRTLLTELGGVRALAFSPAAGGRQVLVMAESADFVHVVDGTNFDRDQKFDFFGEIAGVTFEPEGRRFYVGVGDPDVGGLMEFERSGSSGFGFRDGRWGSGDDEDDDERAMLLKRARWGPKLASWA
ncbi:MAG: hypothetical protein LQ352_006379 [Teloschistes flavicans]|nr:MAG: hypothetical protein LQ352_006379 [Teloschistes flavicans]